MIRAYVTLLKTPIRSRRIPHLFIKNLVSLNHISASLAVEVTGSLILVSQPPPMLFITSSITSSISMSIVVKYFETTSTFIYTIMLASNNSIFREIFFIRAMFPITFIKIALNLSANFLLCT